MQRLTLAERVDHWKRTFPKNRAAWPQLVEEKGQPVFYAVWLGGGNYTNKTRYHGAYPHGYLEKLMAFFPDIAPEHVLHAFAGSVPKGKGLRLDLSAATEPDIVGNVYDVAQLVGDRRFRLTCADPPYTGADNAKYGHTGGINRALATRAIASVTAPRGFMTWLDTRAPIYSGELWRIVGRIYHDRSTGHAIRRTAIFERVESAEARAARRQRQTVTAAQATPPLAHPPNRTPDGGLACAFGEPWDGPHPLCEAETERACRAFDEEVAAGKYDAQGYTPAERKAQARRVAS